MHAIRRLEPSSYSAVMGARAAMAFAEAPRAVATARSCTGRTITSMDWPMNTVPADRSVVSAFAIMRAMNVMIAVVRARFDAG